MRNKKKKERGGGKMRTLPIEPYSGLTVILSNPSRFDEQYGRLLSANGGDWFEKCCLVPPFKRANIEARTADCFNPFLPDTRCLILLGEKAAQQWANTSCDVPGYPLIVNNLPAIAAFDPQDCCDYRNMRTEDYEEEDDDYSDRDTKEKIPTRRKNYRFWTSWHCRKFLSGPSPAYPKLDFQPYPRLDLICKELLSVENQYLFLDIETSRTFSCLSCIGLSWDSIFPRVYVVPVYSYTGRRAYDNFFFFQRALSVAMLRNTVVIHNSHFDLLILCGFYKFAMPENVYDTMIAQHRCFHEAEKSLGHTISCWTDQPFHKDQNTDVFNSTQEQQLWLYNAKDVYNLKLILDAQVNYAENLPGLAASINQANSSIIPYLVMSLNGMRLDMMQLAQVSKSLVKERNLYEKVASILVGHAFNPGSTKQCADFFHKKLNYQVVSRTKTGAPALGKKQLYQLQLKHNNPLIPVILKYRTAAKSASMLESELLTLP